MCPSIRPSKPSPRPALNKASRVAIAVALGCLTQFMQFIMTLINQHEWNTGPYNKVEMQFPLPNSLSLFSVSLSPSLSLSLSLCVCWLSFCLYFSRSLSLFFFCLVCSILNYLSVIIIYKSYLRVYTRKYKRLSIFLSSSLIKITLFQKVSFSGGHWT